MRDNNQLGFCTLSVVNCTYQLLSSLPSAMEKTSIPQSVGIDVSKATIDVAIRFSGTEHELCTFSNLSEVDILECIAWLQSHSVKADTPIIVESTGSYHWLVCLLLSQEGFSVRLINPLITKKYQRASVRGSKTDTIDSKRLAEIGVIEADLPAFFDSRDSLANKKYQALYAKINKVRQQLSRSYKEAKESAESIGISLNLESVQECLEQIKETLLVLKRLIENSSSQLASQVAQIRGVSSFQASVLCNAVEGRRFGNKNQLIAYFGLDIQVKESGTWRGRSKLSKRGNSFYRLVLFQLGWSLARNNQEFGAYYQRLKDDGKHYYTCIIATARKFLRYFFVYFLQPNMK